MLGLVVSALGEMGNNHLDSDLAPGEKGKQDVFRDFTVRHEKSLRH